MKSPRSSTYMGSQISQYSSKINLCNRKQSIVFAETTHGKMHTWTDNHNHAPVQPSKIKMEPEEDRSPIRTLVQSTKNTKRNKHRRKHQMWKAAESDHRKIASIKTKMRTFLQTRSWTAFIIKPRLTCFLTPEGLFSWVTKLLPMYAPRSWN